MPLVNEIKPYSRCSYRLKEIMPLVNGVKFYCIYSQRLSQITVVVSGVKSFFMFHHYSGRLYPLHAFLTAFFISLRNLTLVRVSNIFVNCNCNIRCLVSFCVANLPDQILCLFYIGGGV